MRNEETTTIRNARRDGYGLMPAAVLALLLLAAPATPVHAQSGDAAVDLEATAVPEGAAWARIRHLEGQFTLYQDEASDPDLSGINAPVLPGDILETARDGRLELQLANGSVVWLDQDTRLAVLSLADGRSRFENQTLLSLETGTLAIQVEAFASDEELFRVDTGAATTYLLEEGLYRIESGSAGGTRVTSRRGVAEVLAADRSVLVRSGEGTFTAEGYPPDTPHIVRVTGGDPFDRYVSDRRQAFLSTGAASYAAYDDEIPAEVQPYLVEMDAHGSWSRHPSYGAIWVPRVAVGWRPYTYGYWHRRSVGNVWVSYDSWGYAPYHYGRWEHLAGYGWAWMPGALYSPAWVSWGYSGGYVGWSPVGWYNYPSGWHISIGFGTYHPSYWNFVDYSHLHHHHVNRVVVKERHLAADMTYAARPPRVARASTDGSRSRREAAILTQARNDARRAPLNQVAGRHTQGAQRQSFRQKEVQVAARGGERNDLRRQTAALNNTPQRRAVPATTGSRSRSQDRTSSARREPATRQVESQAPRRILTETRTRRSTAGTPAAATGRSTSRTSTDRSPSSQAAPRKTPAARTSSRSQASSGSSRSSSSAGRKATATPPRSRPGSSAASTPPRAGAGSPASTTRSRATSRSTASSPPSRTAGRSSATRGSTRGTAQPAPSRPPKKSSTSAGSRDQKKGKNGDKGRRR